MSTQPSASPRLEQGEEGLHLAETELPDNGGDTIEYFDALRAEDPYQLIEAGAGHRVAVRFRERVAP